MLQLSEKNYGSFAAREYVNMKTDKEITDVLGDTYFIEKDAAYVGQMTDINACVRSPWVIPDEDGKLYSVSGDEDHWCYVYLYIHNLYKTHNGRVYALNKETFEWELTERLYSELEYYGNFEPISKEKAEEIIRGADADKSV